MKKILPLFILISSCQTIKNSGDNSIINQAVGDIKVINPDYSKMYFYNYNEIKPNFEYYTKIENNLLNYIKEVEEKIEKIDKSPNLPEYQKKRQELENGKKQLEKTQKLKESWSNVGYYNTEFRKDMNEIPKITLNDFDNEKFIGLKKGDFIEKAFSIYGKPLKTEATYYEYDGLTIGYDKSSQKIDRMIVYGKKGCDFIKSKGISDNKTELLGFDRQFVIDRLYGLTVRKNNYKNAYTIQDTGEHNFRQKGLSFWASKENNFKVTIMKVYW